VLFEKVTVIRPTRKSLRHHGCKGPDGEGCQEGSREVTLSGPGAVIVKGGHLEGDPVDILFDGRDTFLQEDEVSPLDPRDGLFLLSALACFLAAGYP
jgi:hydroxymethylpyrimidine/phosphomethylpyrimidine kinase